MTLSTLSDSTDARTVTSAGHPLPSQRTVNPWAAVGTLTLWLRGEGLVPNGTPYTPESSRRRVELMRELLAEFGIESLTAVERAARHTAAKVVRA